MLEAIEKGAPYPIEATTCPYGPLEQHLNDTANCELGDECVFAVKDQAPG